MAGVSAVSTTPADSDVWAKQAWSHLESVRKAMPLIQCITNFVSMDIVANILLAASASPAMIHSIEEIPEFTPKTAAVYINTGTLTPDWLQSMKIAAEVANKFNKPWVLDPVAAGACSFRLKACLDLLKLKPAVVRGNGSEILALFRGSADENTKGVDSNLESINAIEAAKSLAQMTGSIVAVSGAIDIITDGHRTVGAKNGDPMLQKITATGCSVTALITAFISIDPVHRLEATASALSLFGVAAEIAAQMARGPASLRMHLIDTLHGLNRETVLQHVSISRV